MPKSRSRSQPRLKPAPQLMLWLPMSPGGTRRRRRNLSESKAKRGTATKATRGGDSADRKAESRRGPGYELESGVAKSVSRSVIGRGRLATGRAHHPRGSSETASDCESPRGSAHSGSLD